MVATLTFLPFIVTGTIGGLASLDFLGFGLPSSAPSLGEMTLQAKNNLQAPWLGFHRFLRLRDHAVAVGVHLRGLCAMPLTRARRSFASTAPQAGPEGGVVLSTEKPEAGQ